MKLRITGTPQDCAAAVEVLAGVLDVREVSDFYPNRGSSVLGRVYLDVELTTSRGSARPGRGGARRAEA